MDPLRADDISNAQTATPEEKARQAFDMMRTGLRLKRTALRLRHPGATDEEIDALMDAWLEQR